MEVADALDKAHLQEIVQKTILDPLDAHWSYHASGQQHLKKGCNYAEWEPDSTGKLVPWILHREEPMQVIARHACVDPIGWKAAELATALYALTESADMVVDCRHLSGNALLLFKISVVGTGRGSARSGRASRKSRRTDLEVVCESKFRMVAGGRNAPNPPVSSFLSVLSSSRTRHDLVLVFSPAQKGVQARSRHGLRPVQVNQNASATNC
jgi:hypothetical protein